MVNGIVIKLFYWCETIFRLSQSFPGVNFQETTTVHLTLEMKIMLKIGATAGQRMNTNTCR